MEKFMLIFHGGIDQSASPAELESNMGKWMKWVEELNKEGRYVSGEPLLPGGKKLTSNNTITDGPYTEGKELVAGYFIINAKDIDEAAEISRAFPEFEYGGTVQVRQVMKIDM